eukprot:TRINITY_DN2546_c1_g1_i2.p1 TRINITY_DN2546_c1_g1~~TRINITY_DN2546_c1_g1_i2.p1  ORF type:complete len:375 (-),score=23.46 TRINITY_DN2546_c1_g1_i2:104-1228(-)
MVTLSDDRFVLFGGTDSTKTHLNDLWMFDVEQYKWTQLFPKEDAASMLDSTSILGSQTGEEEEEENLLPASNGCPCGRIFHTATAISNDKFLLFGGRRDDVVLGDAFVYDAIQNRWFNVHFTDTERPLARAGHSASLVTSLVLPTPGEMYQQACVLIFGGWDGAMRDGEEYGALNDVNTIHIDYDPVRDRYSGVWRTRTVLGRLPTPRDCHSATLLEDSQLRLYIYGGSDPDFNYLNDMEVLNTRGRLCVPTLFQHVVTWLCEDRLRSHHQQRKRTLATVAPSDIGASVDSTRKKKHKGHASEHLNDTCAASEPSVTPSVRNKVPLNRSCAAALELEWMLQQLHRPVPPGLDTTPQDEANDPTLRPPSTAANQP